MSEQATPSLETMKYNELKALAAEKGLNASGTKEDLIARLKEAETGSQDNVSASEEEGSEGDKGDENAETSQEEDEGEKAPEAPRAPQQKVQPTAEQLHVTRAMRQKAYLDKQPKVMVLIPFEAGENPEMGKKVPFHVSINGYSFDIPRGVMVEVPKDVAQMVRERLESEGRIGREKRIDADPNRAEALS